VKEEVRYNSQLEQTILRVDRAQDTATWPWSRLVKHWTRPNLLLGASGSHNIVMSILYIRLGAQEGII
jgi:hypothetical protein